jgi:ABC-type Fe3+/spermidine/putrescine transport system ATPase subunit
MFEVQNLAKRFGQHLALDNVSFSAKADEYVALLGPSGAGKTVLLRAIGGFEPLDAGRVTLAGQDVTGLPAHERGIGFVFQNFALFPHLSVFENVAFGLRHGAKPIAPDEINSRALEAIAMVGLKGLEERGTGQISGGQKQRVALARTLVTRPRLVLLDEPLGALDANLRTRMRIELRRIREQLGIPFLHVTGSESEALAMGDRVIVLDEGRIAQFGPPDDIYDRPATANVARFLNRYNVFEGRVEGDRFQCAYGGFGFGRRTPSGSSAYAIRYDRITPQAAAVGGAGLKANYVASEYLGAAIVHFFEAADGKVVEVEHHLSNGPPAQLSAGEAYHLTWKPSEAIAFG